MSSSQYHVIQTSADVEAFRDAANDLHDGYITHVAYNNTGIFSHDGGLFFDYRGTTLILHILVTSLLGHPTFEIVFHNIYEWQIKEHGFSDMIAFSIVFLDNGTMLWADDCASDIAELKQGSYVIAESIAYRQL